MGLLLIGALAVGVYYLYENGYLHSTVTFGTPAQQQQAMRTSANNTAANISEALQQQNQAVQQSLPPIPDDTEHATMTAATGAAGAGSAIAGGVAAGVSSTALIATGIGAVAGIGLAIWGAISQHHAAAVKNEARLLNTAYPVFQSDFDGVINAYKGRHITATQACIMLDQVRANYYIQVSNKGAGSIQGKWQWTKGAPDSGIPSNPTAYHFGSPNDWKSKPGVCNGPCVVGHFWVEGPVEQAKEAINGTKKQHTLGYGSGFYVANVLNKNLPNDFYAGAGRYKFGTGGNPPHAGFNAEPSRSYTL